MNQSTSASEPAAVIAQILSDRRSLKTIGIVALAAVTFSLLVGGLIGNAIAFVIVFCAGYVVSALYKGKVGSTDLAPRPAARRAPRRASTARARKATQK